MKKGIIVLLALCILFSGLTSCDNAIKHVHSFENRTEVKAPTCVEAGLYKEVCSCGEERSGTIEPLGHQYDENNVCTICNNQKTLIEAAEARIGTKFYLTFTEAVNDAANMKNVEDRVVDILVKNVKKYNAHSPEINGSIVINAHGADFQNQDVAIFTYKNSSTVCSGTINIVINDAKNLYLWGQPDDQLLDDKTILNITINNSHNTGESSIKNSGRLVYLTGTKATTNVTLNNCYVEKTDSPCYTNNAGIITFNNCTFKECAVPLNFNMKATNKEKHIIVNGCVFDSCGATKDEDSNLAEYAAPIKVVTSVEGAESSLTVKDSAITNTKGENGDILLAIKGTAVYHKVNTSITGNKTNLNVKNTFENGSFITVKAGETEKI